MITYISENEHRSKLVFQRTWAFAIGVVAGFLFRGLYFYVVGI